MSQFKVGDFVKHKLDWVGRDLLIGRRMFVCAVRKEDDFPLGQPVERTLAKEFPIGCRWWNTEMLRFELEWFAVEELEEWKE